MYFYHHKKDSTLWKIIINWVVQWSLMKNTLWINSYIGNIFILQRLAFPSQLPSVDKEKNLIHISDC